MVEITVASSWHWKSWWLSERLIGVCSVSMLLKKLEGLGSWLVFGAGLAIRPDSFHDCFCFWYIHSYLWSRRAFKPLAQICWLQYGLEVGFDTASSCPEHGSLMMAQPKRMQNSARSASISSMLCNTHTPLENFQRFLDEKLVTSAVPVVVSGVSSGHSESYSVWNLCSENVHKFVFSKWVTVEALGKRVRPTQLLESGTTNRQWCVDPFWVKFCALHEIKCTSGDLATGKLEEHQVDCGIQHWSRKMNSSDRFQQSSLASKMSDVSMGSLFTHFLLFIPLYWRSLTTSMREKTCFPMFFTDRRHIESDSVLIRWWQFLLATFFNFLTWMSEIDSYFIVSSQPATCKSSWQQPITIKENPIINIPQRMSVRLWLVRAPSWDRCVCVVFWERLFCECAKQ